jgi:dihydropyrimidinase
VLAVAVGCDADLVIGDPNATETISAKHQVSRIDYNVFEGFTCRGLPRAMLAYGKSRGMRATCGPRPARGMRGATPSLRITFCAPRRIDRVDVIP